MTATSIPQPEWIKFAGSDVYHLASSERAISRRAWRQAVCQATGYLSVLIIGTIEPDERILESQLPRCPRCLAISQQQSSEVG